MEVLIDAITHLVTLSALVLSIGVGLVCWSFQAKERSDIAPTLFWLGLGLVMGAGVTALIT